MDSNGARIVLITNGGTTKNNPISRGSILTRSLKLNQSDEFLLKLIRNGCDFNQPSEEDLQPLHLAMQRPSLYIAHELIKSGADVNAQDDWQWTPLQYAVRRGSLEATCMLLYYGADVTIADCSRRTPLMNAFELEEEHLAEVLISYYNEFACTSVSDARALDYALWNRSPLAVDLVKAGADVNRSINERGSPIIRSFKHYHTNELFKEIWSRLDHEQMLSKRPSFLLAYLNQCIFVPAEWLESLILILSCHVAAELMEECENSMSLRMPFMTYLLHHLLRNEVKPGDRLTIINICLSLGATVKLLDIHSIICFCRHQYNDELESLIYGGDICMNGYLPKCIRSQSVFILGMEDDEDHRLVFDYCKIIIMAAPTVRVLNCVEAMLRHFSVPAKVRKELDDLCNRRFGDEAQFSKRIEGIPQVPSLLELSRNSARRFIRDAYKVKKPYQFHDAVKKLPLPHTLKDVIRFKTPLY